MRKFYNTPSIKITTYSTIDNTSLKLETSSPIAIQYNGTEKIDKDTFVLEHLNS